VTNDHGEKLYFATPAELRAWFEANHETAKVLLLGYYRVGSGKPSVTWPQSVDEALCVGWIDGVRRSIDAESYFIRFTPRKAKSYWSKINLARFEALTQEGRVLPAGLAAYEKRSGVANAAYSFEQDRAPAFTPEQEARFRANAAAWAHFEKMAPSYRRASTWWVASAKQEATWQRRLAELITQSEAGERIRILQRRQPK
jgi:uncharacterized protein YdeI (YjbR/CyaY-like superfamily)